MKVGDYVYVNNPKMVLHGSIVKIVAYLKRPYSTKGDAATCTLTNGKRLKLLVKNLSKEPPVGEL